VSETKGTKAALEKLNKEGKGDAEEGESFKGGTVQDVASGKKAKALLSDNNQPG